MVTVAIASHAVETLQNKDLGSVSNRISAAGEHVKNDATTYLKEAGVLGTVGAGVYATANKGKITNSKVFTTLVDKAKDVLTSPTVSKFANSVKNAIENKFPNLFSSVSNLAGKASKYISKFISKAATAIAKNPKTALAAAVVSLVTGLALNKISKKGAYEEGKIDQKYTDKAQFKKKQMTPEQIKEFYRNGGSGIYIKKEDEEKA